MAKKATKKAAKKAVKKVAKKPVKKAAKKKAARKKATAGILPGAAEYPRYVISIVDTDGVTRRFFGPHTDLVAMGDISGKASLSHNETTPDAGPNLTITLTRE